MKQIRIALCALLLLLVIRVPAHAAPMEDATVDVDIPSELEEYLPFDPNTMSPEDLQNAFDFRFFSDIAIKILAAAVPDAAKSFALLLGLFIMSAILQVVKDTIAVPTLQTAMNLCSMVCMAGAVFAVMETVFSFTETYIESISSFLRQITPVMAAFLAASGHFTSASAVSGVIFLAVSLLESVAAGVLFPLIRLSLCLSIVSNVFSLPGIGGIAPYLRKIISYIFGTVTLCLSAVLMFQSILGKSADSLALRGIKFAIGNFVPFVGGAVNEALSTVVGGLGTIKAATGVTGAVIVLLLAAVPVVRILLHKFFLELLSCIGGLLGLSGETKLMGEIASFLGYTAAIMAISAVFFILSLSMMASV